MARNHNVRDSHGRFSVKMASEFFPLLQKKRWSKAERLLETETKKTDQDEWIKGYSHALMGMIVALNGSYSTPKPYVFSLKEFSEKKLKEIKKSFGDFSNMLTTKNEFDAAYFQAWEDFTQYVIHS